MEMMCLHCLEEGDWDDEDKCPKCAAAGHTSPWTVSGCEACNRNYFAKMDLLKRDIGIREKGTNEAIADLQSRVRKLELLTLKLVQ